MKRIILKKLKFFILRSNLEKFYSISSNWFALISFLLVLLIGSVVSFITGGNSDANTNRIDSKYISPIYEAARIRFRKIKRTKKVRPIDFTDFESIKN